MFKSLVGQFNIVGKAALSSLAPSLWRLGLVLLGLILGLIWAYQGAPVKFRDAEPVHLADGYKDQWIKMTAVEYVQYQDADEAKRKLEKGGITTDMINELISENQASPELVGQLQALVPLSQEVQAAAQDQADKIESNFLSSLVLGPLGCIIGAAIIGILLALLFTFYWAVPIGKWAKPSVRPGAVLPTGTASAAHTASVAARHAAADQRTDFAAVGEVPPITQYMSTYIYGNDLYDDSFSIETPAGEFLGECGSGISETIGVGEPKKVTAVEVWLFDKNDIRTITSVLMSEHAYNDQALRTKLAPKGEAVLAAPNAVTMLETQTLRLRVRIIDLQYGEGPLPPRSFFERLTVEIAAWPKEGVGEGTLPPDSSAAFGDTAELLNY